MVYNISDFASARHFRILRKGFLIEESISNQFRHFNFESVKKIRNKNYKSTCLHVFDKFMTSR